MRLTTVSPARMNGGHVDWPDEGMTSRVMALFVSSSPGTIRTERGTGLSIASHPRAREHKALPMNLSRGSTRPGPGSVEFVPLLKPGNP